MIYRFLHEIKKGDYVVYPSKHDRLINIGRATGEFVYEIGASITLFQIRNHATEFLAKVNAAAQPKATVEDDAPPDDDKALSLIVQQSERNLSKLRLIDGEQLFGLIVKHYADLSPRYRTLIPLRQIYVPGL